MLLRLARYIVHRAARHRTAAASNRLEGRVAAARQQVADAVGHCLRFARAGDGGHACVAAFMVDNGKLLVSEFDGGHRQRRRRVF
jgi:hypothetical protein